MKIISKTGSILLPSLYKARFLRKLGGSAMSLTNKRIYSNGQGNRNLITL
jgi:hypothetical protein